jgi:YD repeat-containing protein
VGARLLVGAVVLLVAAAAVEALHRVGASEVVAVSAGVGAERGEEADTGFTLAGAGTYEGDGRLLRTRVLRSGLEHLSAEEVGRAFPGADRGLLDILRVAVAPGGTLVLGVIRFPPGRTAQSGVELWQGRRLRGAFLVPPGSFGGGFAFDRAGTLIALFSADGALRSVYDLDGRRVEDFADRLLLGR